MNERIRLLAEQASHQSPDGYPVTIPYSNDFVKKFAELIIQDCVEITQDWEWHVNRYGVSKDILEHFGVEE